MSNEWDRYAADWDDDPAARAYASAAFEALLTVIGSGESSLEGAHVLDFGCGTGLLTERLVAAGANVVAVDTSRAMLAELDEKVERLGWTTVRTSAELSDETSAVDLVVCSSVCAFVDDYPATALGLTSRLVPGGLFVQWDWERDEADGHGLTRVEIRDALTSAGLDDVHVDTGFSIDVGGHTMAPLMGHGRAVLRGATTPA